MMVKQSFISELSLLAAFQAKLLVIFNGYFFHVGWITNL